MRSLTFIAFDNDLTVWFRLEGYAPARKNMHARDFRRALGLGEKGKLPVEGVAPVQVANVKMWCEPVDPSRKYKASRPHRVMVECPDCRKTVPAGRLHQHRTVHR